MSFIAYKIISEGAVQNVNIPRERVLTRLQVYQRLLGELQHQRQRLIELEHHLGLNN